MRLLSLEEAIALLPAHGVPVAFSRILNGQPLHPSIDGYWRRPTWLFSAPDFFTPYLPYFARFHTLIPLCEEGDIAALVACGLREGGPEFVHLVYEFAEPPRVFRCYQSLLVPLFRFRWELEDSDAALRSLAEHIDLSAGFVLQIQFEGYQVKQTLATPKFNQDI